MRSPQQRREGVRGLAGWKWRTGIVRGLRKRVQREGGEGKIKMERKRKEGV